MSFWNDAKTFITGRNGIYEDEKAVNQAKEDLKRIINNDVEDAKEQIRQSIVSITNCQGFSEYVGSFEQTSFYDETIDCASIMINDIIGQIEAKAANIKEYNESSLTDKILGSGGMVLAKFGEGVLSVGEGIADTAATVLLGGGTYIWGLTSGDMSAYEGVGKIVKKDLSHDAFNFYYKSDLAKASAFTEDSAIASLAEGIGVTTGYLALGGFVSGFSKTAALKSTTNATTAVTFLSSWGNNTESGLQAGKSFGSATKQGLVAATAEAAMAYIGGKAGEKAQKAKAIDNATEKLETATKAREEAAKLVQQGVDAPESMSDGMFEQAKNAFDDAMEAQIDAQKALEKVKASKLSSYQGYNDPLTKFTRAKGEAARTALAQTATKREAVGLIFNKGREAIGNTITKGGETAGKAIAKSGETVGNIITNPKATGIDLINSAKQSLPKIKEGVKTGMKALGETYVQPITAGALAGPTVGKVVSDQVFKSKSTNIQPPDVKPQSGFSATPSGTSNGGGSTGGETGGTDNTTENQQSTSNENGNGNGNSNRTYSGGGSSYTPSGSTYSGGNASTQFTNSQPTTQNNQTTTTDTSKTPTVPNNKTEDVLKPSTDTPKQPNTPNTTPSGSTNNPTTSNPNPNPNSSPSNPNHNTNTNTNPSPSPSNPSPSNNPTSNGSGNAHTGGGYSGSGGYQEDTTSNGILDSDKNEIDAALEKGKASIDDVIKGNITKIPSSTTPIKTTPTTKNGNNGSYVIPTVAGLSAAAAAGIGTKAYLDNKSNNYNGEDSDEIETEEWAGENDVEIEYDDNAEKEAYLDEDDEFGYTDTDTATEETEKYDARNNTELADLQ